LRYDQVGFLRTPAPSPAASPQPYADRAAEISAMADRLLHQQALRASNAKPEPKPARKPRGGQQQKPPPVPRSKQGSGR
jgi:hypothetical protein